MPKMMMRSRYEDFADRKDGFPFTETINRNEDQLWGGACYAVGETLIRSFAESRWLADIRGASRGVAGGGVVTGPAREDFLTDSPGIALKPFTDLMVGDSLEMQMVDLGFMPLCNCKDAGYSAFYSTPSTQKPKTYNDLSATTNAKMSSMLNYMFCVSRFAHYIKVMGRDKIGAFKNPDDMQYELNDWLRRYVTADADADESIKSKYPLRDAEVQVLPTPGKPGAFDVIMRLSPHFQLEDMQASIQLRAELVRK
jgi:type VI secretion system protein ImpD